MCLQLRKQRWKAVQLIKELIQLVGMALEGPHGQMSLSKSSAFSPIGASLIKLCRTYRLSLRRDTASGQIQDQYRISGQHVRAQGCQWHRPRAQQSNRRNQTPPTWVCNVPASPLGPLLTDPVAKTLHGFSAPCLQCVHWMTSRSQTWPKMCLCELMNWFNCLPNLRAAKSNKLKFTILWSHLQGDNSATVYFVRCCSESGENYSPCIILIIIIIIKILLIGNTDACFAPLTCTIVSACLAADSAGQGVLIPGRQNWLHSHNSSQQLHAVAREFNNHHGCSMAASMGGSARPDEAL